MCKRGNEGGKLPPLAVGTFLFSLQRCSGPAEPSGSPNTPREKRNQLFGRVSPPRSSPPSLGPLYPRTVSGHDENQPGPAASRQTNCVPNFPPFFFSRLVPEKYPRVKKSRRVEVPHARRRSALVPSRRCLDRCGAREDTAASQSPTQSRAAALGRPNPRLTPPSPLNLTLRASSRMASQHRALPVWGYKIRRAEGAGQPFTIKVKVHPNCHILKDAKFVLRI